MNKKVCFHFLALLFSFIILNNAFAAPWINLKLTYDFSTHNYKAEAVYIKVNGTALDSLEMPPIIMNNFTLVPAREVFEHIGAIVDWKKETEEIYIAYENDIAVIKINSKFANCNGVAVEMPLPFKIINNKTMVPVRFISEAFGFDVNWVNDERTIYINTPKKEINAQNNNLPNNQNNQPLDNPQETHQNLPAAQELVNTNPTPAMEVGIAEKIENDEVTQIADSLIGTLISRAIEINTESFSEALSETDTGSSAYINTADFKTDSLPEINFDENFYYDRNMKNLVISSSYISGGVDSIVEQKKDKKHYFTFTLSQKADLKSGYYQIDDDNVTRIDFVNFNGEFTICFNEKNVSGYKVYEERGIVYFKPFV